jgi:signal transduction histidine kinase
MEYWYWEFMVIPRKVLIVAIAVYYSSELQMQALSSLLLVSVCIGFQSAFRPFLKLRTNGVEFLSLITSWVTFYCGQFLFLGIFSTTTEEAVSIIIVTVNALYVIILHFVVISISYHMLCCYC